MEKNPNLYNEKGELYEQWQILKFAQCDLYKEVVIIARKYDLNPSELINVIIDVAKTEADNLLEKRRK